MLCVNSISICLFSKPKFLDDHVKRIMDGWDVTKEKATQRLQFLQKTKDAWVGYAEGLETIATEFEKAEEEMKKVKKRFNLQSAIEDLEKRQKIFDDSKNNIENLYKSIQENYDIMTMTLPDDKKDFVKKEVKAITEKLDCVGKFEEKVKKIDNFVTNLKDFDLNLKTVDKWMTDAEQQLKDIKESSDKMTPEDRVSYTMELQEDIAEKVKIVQKQIETETGLLPQGIKSLATSLPIKINSSYSTLHLLLSGEKVPQDAQDFKEELKRIEKFVLDLQQQVIKECESYSEDVKYWAEYKTGIKEFRPWLDSAEKKSTEGLQKPQTLEEATAMFNTVKDFGEACAKHFKVLNAANNAANKMTTHKEADVEVAALKERYEKVKLVGDEWIKKVETLVKEWQLLDNTVTELNSWVAKDEKSDEKVFSLEKMESTLGELKNIFKEKEKLVEDL